MPTPVGHSLMGYILYTERKKANWKLNWKDLLVFLLVANLPDIDYLPGFLAGNPNQFHQKMTHSLGFAIIVGIILGLIYHLKEKKNFFKYFIIFATIYSSHLFLDFIGKDTRAPYGEQLFWPISNIHVLSPIAIFSDVHKASASDIFFQSLCSWHNLWSVMIEVLILLPVLLVIQKSGKRFKKKFQQTKIKVQLNDNEPDSKNKN